MGFETVNYTCGHSEREQFYGKHSDRDRDHAWKERNICPSCWSEEKQKDREHENRVAAFESEKSGLPALTGSEKQIAWANTIRLKIIQSMDVEVKTEKAAMVAELVAWLKSVGEAKFWIDNRDQGKDWFARHYFTEIKK